MLEVCKGEGQSEISQSLRSIQIDTRVGSIVELSADIV